MTTDTNDTTILNTDNPFPGLRSFAESDSNFFLGRGDEIDELYRRVKTNELTICFGRSGLGKTSLLLAGLFPRLRESGYFPIYIRMGYAEGSTSLSPQVLSQTIKAAQDNQVDIPNLNNEKTDETLWEYFHRAEFWSSGFKLLTPVIVFDQFEELFTLIHQSDTRRAAFIEQLSDLIENRIPRSIAKTLADMEEQPYSFDQQPYRVVLSLREDFLPDLETLRRFIPSLAKNRMRILPMNGQAAYKVVTQIEGRVSNEIATDIVRFVANADQQQPLEDLTVEPVLLSIFCRELNNARIADGLTTITRDLLKSRSDEILNDFYDNTLAGYNNEHDVRRFIEERLLTGSGRRNPIALEDALTDDANIDELCITKLIDDRLIRRDERDGVWLELTHDLLTDAIRDSRDKRRAAENQQRKIELEEENQRQADNLKTARRLVALLTLLALVASSALVYAVKARHDALEAEQNAVKAQKLAENAKNEADIAIEKAKKLSDIIKTQQTIIDSYSPKKLEVQVADQKDVDDALKEFSEANVNASVAALGYSSAEKATNTLLDQLNSESQSKREEAYRELVTGFSEDTRTIKEILQRLKDNKFDSKSRIRALNFLLQTTLSTWTESLVKDGREVLEDMLSKLGQSEEDTRAITKQTLIMTLLAGINLDESDDPAYVRHRRRTTSDLVNQFRDNKIVVREIESRLSAGQFGLV